MKTIKKAGPLDACEYMNNFYCQDNYLLPQQEREVLMSFSQWMK